ncbi:glycosyltransferase family 2 protein [Mycolicibacterium baixiangningiae]|uniref:glycosyltransferase family 2 protein n=1 Tax=Mycolicibacterium baixiangningiae TaxID=2761578 RepID=UPI001867842B|nr:glycosyltransferase [Mycolicibacterium baixiangningiae]
MTIDANAKFGVAISTVGRWGPLKDLLGDLVTQRHPPVAVAIAHHDEAHAADLADTVGMFADVLDIRTVVSPRGISNGRNAAAALLGNEVDWLWFPNDTSRVQADFLQRACRHCVPPTTVCAGQMVDSEGPRNPLPAAGRTLTRRSVWGAIEPATLFRRDEFIAAGGFNPAFGTGADTPWQSGEGIDLLLRLADRPGFAIEWAPDIEVTALTEFAHLPVRERSRKQRSYGRGAGYVLRTWNYPIWYQVAHVAAAALMPLRNPEKFSARESFALMVGRFEGVLGRPFPGDGDHRAILR